jgi:hypothetical protein
VSEYGVGARSGDIIELELQPQATARTSHLMLERTSSGMRADGSIFCERQ